MMETLQGSERQFSTQTLIVLCCDEGEICLSVHAFEDLNRKGKKRCLMYATPPSFSFTHTHTCYISPASDRRGEREAQRGSSHWSVYSSRVMRSGRDGLSSVPLIGDTEGTRMRWIRGDFFRMREGQAHHQWCLISSNTHPPTLNTAQKPNHRYREVLKRQVTWRQGLG